ncbi:MAG: tetratricopeptide repeat protein [Betaproteobacteria bacterium]|nr:tetratricopeptide repeat protein [Betaproteobacteria bacterium]
MYDLEEQETVDAIKAWWKANGRWVWAALLALAVGYGAARGWQYYRAGQEAKAGVLFDAVRTAAQQGDAAKTLQAAKALQSAQPSSPLAPRGALISAAVSHAKGESAPARQELEWVISNAKEPSLTDLAHLRLAGLLADQKKYDEALRQLDGARLPDFIPMTQDLRGDILLAQGKTKEARAAYQAALQKSKDGEVMHQIAKSKLDALGGQ